MQNLSFTGMTRALLAAAITSVIAACSASDVGNVSGNLADKVAPTIHLSKGGTVADTVIAFQVEVKDNLGIKTIQVDLTGGLKMSFDTTFTTANTNAIVPFTISVPRSIPKGTPVTATAYAVDGAGNRSPLDSLALTVGNVPEAEAVINSPANGTIAVVGKSIVLSMSGRSAVKIRSLGFRTSGSFVAADSSNYNSPLPDSVSRLDTLAIPANAPTGALTVVPFVLDSLGQRTLGPAIQLNVQPQTAINSTPSVAMFHSPRVEVDDTLR